MKGNIEVRLSSLVEQLVQDSTGKLIVTFADGHKEHVTGQDAVRLVEVSPDRCGCFSGGDGRLAGLLNALLEI